MTSAVYARQSVEKKNSLSIEGQIDLCRRTAGRELAVYTDRGYSGKNTQRPDFQRLMRDIRGHRIERVYVYRLDRFSRSVADFGRLWEILRENQVEFVSVSENFDTSTPMGRAMLHIIMVFAQLERETTAERVRDNYYKRASLGAWPGGPAPYGFRIGRSPGPDGRLIPTLAADPERAEVVRRVFSLYSQEGESLGSIARRLNAERIPGPRRDTWDNVSLSRLLRCPIYVRANEEVRLYYQGLRVAVTSGDDAFDGRHGLLLIGGGAGAQESAAEAPGRTLSVLNSEGIVEPGLWLACQDKLRRNRQVGNAGKGTHTWLTGLLKCAECGYSVKVTQTGAGRYLHCSGRYNLSKCKADIRVDLTLLEDAASEGIQALLDESPEPCAAPREPDRCAAQLAELDRRAERLTDAFAGSTEMTAGYLHRALQEVAAERQLLLDAQKRRRSRDTPTAKSEFRRLSFAEKRLAAPRFIRRILLAGEEADILWEV